MQGISRGSGHSMLTKGNALFQAYRKKGHPRFKGGMQQWEDTDISDTLTIFDNSETRTPILIVQEVKTDGTDSILDFGKPSSRQQSQNL